MQRITPGLRARRGEDMGAGNIQKDQEDDGRTIVDMNVDGMPWYVPGDEDREKGAGRHDEMSPEDFRTYRFAALKAALLVALVFGTVFFLFLLFCDYIWFR